MLLLPTSTYLPSLPLGIYSSDVLSGFKGLKMAVLRGLIEHDRLSSPLNLL